MPFTAQSLANCPRNTAAASIASVKRRVVTIFVRFTDTTGHQHPHLRAAIRNYTALLEQMGYSEEQVNSELDKIGSPFGIKLGSDKS
jgi:hypothetical protein